MLRNFCFALLGACCLSALSLLTATTASAQSCPVTIDPFFDQSNPATIDLGGALDLRPGDFDGDGDTDLAYFTYTSPTNETFRFYENILRECSQHLSCNPSIPSTWFVDANDKWLDGSLIQSKVAVAPSLRRIYELLFLDIDGDGDKDMIAGRGPGEDLIFVKTNGVFQPSRPLDKNGTEASDYLPGSTRLTTGIDYGDVDQDGDYDLVVSARASRPVLYLNDGGFFTQDQKLPLPPGEGPPFLFGGNGNRDIKLRDLDRDGDVDLLVARMSFTSAQTTPSNTSVLVYRNDGPGSCGGGPFCFDYQLTDANGALDLPNGSFSIEPADVDGDGDIDLIQPMLKVVIAGVPTAVKTRIYLNDGCGNLGQNGHRPDLTFGDAASTAVAEVADLDRDGDLDVVLGYHQGATDRIYRNDGVDASGHPIFTPTLDVLGNVGPAADNTRYIRFADLDLDGDLDYCEANFGTGANPAPASRIFLNLWSDSQP